MTTNLHYHVTSNGVIVSHSHPYSSAQGSPANPSHSHSDSEINLLALLTSAGVGGLMIMASISLPVLCFKVSYIRFKAFHIPSLECLSAFTGRGPPHIS